MTTAFKPYENDTQSTEIAGITIENKGDSLALYGQADFDASKEGLAKLQALLPILEAAVKHLQAQKDLPDALATIAPTTGANPFA